MVMCLKALMTPLWTSCSLIIVCPWVNYLCRINFVKQRWSGGWLLYPIEILKSDCCIMNPKKVSRQWKHFCSEAHLLPECLGQTAKQSAMLSLFSRAFTLWKRQLPDLVWVWPRHKDGTSAEAAPKDAAGCSSWQRYPIHLWIWSRTCPLTSSL